MIGSGTTLSPPSTGVSAVRVPSLSQERSSRELRGQASAAGAGPAQVPEKVSRPRAMKKGDKMRNLPSAEPPNCGCFPPCRFGGRQRTDDLLQEYVRKITASWQTNFAFATKTIACLASYGDLPRGIEEGADHLAGGTLTQADQRLVHQHLAVGEIGRAHV